jgi:serine/threonine protein kinase
MGEVYKAHDPRLKRDVALKVLPAMMAPDAGQRQRFEREAQALAALNHPNIVTVYSVEEAEGLPFLTMEFVDGKPLANLIPRKGLSLETFFKLAIPLADALGAAHHRGITHRDLKPKNIMVTGDGRVKVLDFGLAKLREHQVPAADVSTLPTEGLTGSGWIIGTVAYISPEQAEGKPFDERSDIFSLGIVLYEMATGDRPFKGATTVSTLSSIIKDTPAPATNLNRNLPRDLGRIIRHALAKDPERRYQTAKDLRNDLEDLKETLGSKEWRPGGEVQPYDLRVDPLKNFGPSAFGPLRFRPVSDDGRKGDWQPLATLVRLPSLKEVRCPDSPDNPCQLSGSNLFLIGAVASDAQFARTLPVPPGFTEATLTVPRPNGTLLYLKLRDDRETVNTVVLPVLPER